MAVQKVDVRLAEKGLLWDYERNRPVQIVGGRVPKYAVAKSALLQIAKLGNKQVDSRKKRSKVNYSRSKMS